MARRLRAGGLTAAAVMAAGLYGCQQSATGDEGGALVKSSAQALSPTSTNLFELDKNATDNLAVTGLGVLQSAATDSATSLVVCESGTEPATPFNILVDGEQMTVTSASSGSGGGCSFTVRSFTVTRAVNQTTATSHAKGAGVNTLTTSVLPGTDWDQVYAQVNQDSNDTGDDDRCTNLGAVECAFAHDPEGSTIFTTGGSKDDLDIPNWRYTNGSVPDSDEILDAFAAKFVQSGQQYLYFGADRLAQNGSKDFGFWFLHNPISLKSDGTFDGSHTVPSAGQSGDILILGTFTGGGAVTTIRVFEWVGTGGDATANGTVGTASGSFGDCVSSPGNDGCGTVNNLSIPAPWGFKAKGQFSGFIPSGGFFEGGVNLTQLGLEGCFSTFVAETRSAPSVDAQLKDFVIGQFEACGSTTTTTPKDGTGAALGDADNDNVPDLSIGTGRVSVKDSTTVSVNGTSTFAGTVKFYLCGPMETGTCTTGGTLVSTHSVDQTTTFPLLSSAATVSSVGRYCWRADFTSTTPGVPPSSDSSSTECFETLPVTPPLDTAAVASPVNFGQAVQDNATLSGTATQPGSPIINGAAGAAAGGTIRFTLLKSDCSTLATGTGTNPQTVNVTGDGTYGPVSFTPDAPGTYHWKAEYIPASGDVNNLGSTHNGSCTDTDETVVVNQVPTSITTRQFVFPQDKAQITASAGGNLSGTVTFKLYDTLANCNANTSTGLLFGPSSTTISGASPQSATTNNTTARVASNTTVYWRVTYLSNNASQLDSASACTESTATTFSGDDSNLSIP